MDQSRNQNSDMPNRQSNMEPAEGSRETAANSGGITNRPLDREESEQRELPERGHSKADESRDAGKTSGGGSLGHTQPEEVADTAPLRNNPKP